MERLGDAVARVLEDLSGIVAAYAFGSHVSGRPVPLNDLNIARVTSEDATHDGPLLAERVAARLTLELDSSAEQDIHIVSSLPRLVPPPSRRVGAQRPTARPGHDHGARGPPRGSHPGSGPGRLTTAPILP